MQPQSREGTELVSKKDFVIYFW